MSTEQAQTAIASAQLALDKIKSAHDDIAQAQHELREILASIPAIDFRPSVDFLNDPLAKLMQFYWGFKIGTKKK